MGVAGGAWFMSDMLLTGRQEDVNSKRQKAIEVDQQVGVWLMCDVLFDRTRRKTWTARDEHSSQWARQ